MGKIVENALEEDDERTGHELSKILQQHGYAISASSVLRCRKRLGWTCRGSAYCQLIHDGNKFNRLEWARMNMEEDHQNVIFTDECSVQLETHRKRAC